MVGRTAVEEVSKKEAEAETEQISADIQTNNKKMKIKVEHLLVAGIFLLFIVSQLHVEEGSGELTISDTKFTYYRGYGFMLKEDTTLLVELPTGEIAEVILPAKIDDMVITYKGKVREGVIKISVESEVEK